MLILSPVEAFSDNYIWVLHNRTEAIAVDPGDARPLIAWLDAQHLDLKGVLITHLHRDHIGGLDILRQRTPGLPVMGPATLDGATRQVGENDQVNVLGITFRVLSVPGHTLDHLAYYAAPWLFCGDTLFGAGCGRLFEGTPAQMHASLSKLAALPPETLVCPAHEYTIDNLHFALAVEPDNNDIKRRMAEDKSKRDNHLPTLPSTIARERATNPFLRTGDGNIQRSASLHAGRPLTSPVEIFGKLREWKDGFRRPAN
jgi:hydroxyacylglutathione hydrolase